MRGRHSWWLSAAGGASVSLCQLSCSGSRPAASASHDMPVAGENERGQFCTLMLFRTFDNAQQVDKAFASVSLQFRSCVLVRWVAWATHCQNCVVYGHELELVF